MTIKQLQEPTKNWDSFVQENAQDSGVLQSTHWALFQKKAHQKNVQLSPLFFQLISNDTIIAQCLLFLSSLPFGMHTIYIPRGPVIKEGENIKEVYRLLFDEIKKQAKEKHLLYVDIDPLSKEEMFFESELKKLSHPRQPQETLILDLTQSEDELLSQMKPKTRYNITLAKKHGVHVKKDNTENGKNAFLELIKKTAKRQQFTSHQSRYYKKMMDCLIPNDMLHIYTASYNDHIIAAHLMVYFGDTAIYLHGASLYEYRNKMAPHLLQYHQIMDAKKNGYKKYDFWGVATKGSKQKAWEGITRFKLGFQKNAKTTEYPCGYRKIMNKKWYFLYRMYQVLRRFI